MEHVMFALIVKVAVNNFADMYMMWKTVSTMLQKKRPTYIYVLFFVMRFFIYTIPSMEYFQQMLAARGILELYIFLCQSFWVTALFFLIYYFWKGDFLKNIFGTLVAEILMTPVVGLRIAVTNLIAGEENLGTYLTEEFSPANVIVPVLYVFLFMALFRFVKPWVLRYRDWEIKSRPLAWSFVFIYLIAQYVLAIKVSAVSYVGPIVICSFCILCVALGMGLYRGYLKRERAYLYQTQKKLEVQYREIQTQIQTIERMRPKMEAYIDEIGKSQAGTGSEQLVSDYLEELKDKYQTLDAGIYSNDPMIDTVLSCYADVCKEEHIPLEISTWTYRAEAADRKETERRLTGELEKAVQRNKNLPEDQRGLRVTLGTVKGQVILNIEDTYSESAY